MRRLLECIVLPIKSTMSANHHPRDPKKKGTKKSQKSGLKNG